MKPDAPARSVHGPQVIDADHGAADAAAQAEAEPAGRPASWTVTASTPAAKDQAQTRFSKPPGGAWEAGRPCAPLAGTAARWSGGQFAVQRQTATDCAWHHLPHAHARRQVGGAAYSPTVWLWPLTVQGCRTPAGYGRCGCGQPGVRTRYRRRTSPARPSAIRNQARQSRSGRGGDGHPAGRSEQGPSRPDRKSVV